MASTLRYLCFKKAEFENNFAKLIFKNIIIIEL